MLAAQGRHTETVKALIDAGAKVNLRKNIMVKFLESEVHAVF